MIKQITLAAASLLLCMGLAQAADTKPAADAKAAPTAQQSKMGECNKDAAD
jgi:opacity protein-like surface antigen